MGNEDGKHILDNLYLVIKGENTMFVDKQLYKQLKELKDHSDNLYDVYDILSNDVENEYNIAFWWFNSDEDHNKGRTREKNMLNWMDGNIEIKPEPEKKYRVYCSVGRDSDGDEWYMGLINNHYDVFSINTKCGSDDFQPVTKDVINKFEANTGIKFPQSAWHEVDQEEELPF